MTAERAARLEFRHTVWDIVNMFTWNLNYNAAYHERHIIKQRYCLITFNDSRHDSGTL